MEKHLNILIDLRCWRLAYQASAERGRPMPVVVVETIFDGFGEVEEVKRIRRWVDAADDCRSGGQPSRENGR